MSIVEERWQDIIEHLRKEHELANISFNSWIKPLRVFSVVDNTVYIIVKNNIEYIERKYLVPLKVCIAEILDCEYDVVLISEDDERLKTMQMAPMVEPPLKRKTSTINKDRNEKYTFDTFVVGGNNNFAHAASLAVAKSPGNVYNPLFLYGGVGLGKTHLMHSISHYIAQNEPGKKVLYVTSEMFTNDLIEALKKGKDYSNELEITKFRNKYRNIDVLLIDDIQFIIGKESTQEEFFHTFNHLHSLGKQIVISSDRPPKEIETLEARLRTRFEMGLIADISAPNYETRMAILQKRIELDNLEKYNISSEVLDYIASNVKSNIRELEGSLNRLTALYKVNGLTGEIDIPLAAEAIKEYITKDETRVVTPDFIMEIVADHFNITVADLKSSKRNTEISVPRQICMYLMRTMTDTSLKTIGIYLGKKDHSTVKHGVDKITGDLTTDESLANTISIIKKKINPF